MNQSDQTTIAAIATPQGYGGIGVIRLSGPASLSLVRQLIKSSNEVEFLPNHSVFHVLVHPETKLLIDEAIVTYYRAPHSFTGEDVVEISCHGSPVIMAEVIQVLTALGARPAEPGEFSLRAFLNHRLDLAQAEAINDLINAQTAYQARLAARQVRGELSRQLCPIKEGLIDLIVHFESTVEFVEDDLDPVNLKIFLDKLDFYIDTLDRMAASYRVGRIIRSGVRLALIGLPNVGKSSIFNSLLGRDRAIVTHLPGTTRDTLSEALSLNGLPVNLVDTAGIRETEDIVEKIGVERTRTAITEADFVIAVIEADSLLPPEEVELLVQFPVNLYVVNKCDLGSTLSADRIAKVAQGRAVIELSAKTGEGLEDLKLAIYQTIVSENQNLKESAIITNERHYRALEEALAQLRRAKQDLQAGFTEEIALDNLHLALRSLGLVTGETLIGDIINQIFATFCIGK